MPSLSGPSSPGKSLSLACQKSSTVIQEPLLDALAETLGGHFRRHVAAKAHHLGLHIVRLQDSGANAPRLQVLHQRNAGGIEGGLGHAIAILTARAGVRHRPHAAGDQSYLAAGAEISQQCASR